MNNDSKKTVYFVRHGQSTDNIRPIFQNKISELTNLGQAQCKEVALELVRLGIKIDRTISSPLLRAAQSAQIINSIIGGKLEFLAQLSERRLPSVIEGKPYSNKSHQIYGYSGKMASIKIYLQKMVRLVLIS